MWGGVLRHTAPFCAHKQSQKAAVAGSVLARETASDDACVVITIPAGFDKMWQNIRLRIRYW